jgi:hypothetical protein
MEPPVAEQLSEVPGDGGRGRPANRPRTDSLKRRRLIWLNRCRKAREKHRTSLNVIRFIWDDVSDSEVDVSRTNKIRRVDTPNWKKPLEASL